MSESAASDPTNLQTDHLQKLLDNIVSHETLSSLLSQQQKTLLNKGLADGQIEAINQTLASLEQDIGTLLDTQNREKQQLDEIHDKSYAAIQALLDLTGKMQKTFSEDSRNLKKCQDRMNRLHQQLHEKLDHLVTEQSLEKLESSLNGSWTSAGFNDAITDFLKKWADMLNELGLQVSEHRQSIHLLYSNFQQHNGIGVIQPKPYTIQPRLTEFEKLHDEALHFTGSFKLAFNSSSSLAKSFHEKIGMRLVALLEDTRNEIANWIDDSLKPLSYQVDEQKEVLERKLAELDSAIQSREQLESHLEKLNALHRHLEANRYHIRHYLKTAGHALS